MSAPHEGGRRTHLDPNQPATALGMPSSLQPEARRPATPPCNRMCTQAGDALDSIQFTTTRRRARMPKVVPAWHGRARLLCLLGTRLAAPGGSIHLGREAGPLGAGSVPRVLEPAALEAANS